MSTEQKSVIITGVVGNYKKLQVREVTRLVEGKKVLSAKNHRYVVSPDQDVSEMAQVIQDAAAKYWTVEIKNNWERVIA